MECLGRAVVDTVKVPEADVARTVTGVERALRELTATPTEEVSRLTAAANLGGAVGFSTVGRINVKHWGGHTGRLARRGAVLRDRV